MDARLISGDNHSTGFKALRAPSDYFRRQDFVTYQQDQYLEPIIPLIGEDNIIWGACENVTRLYRLG